MTTDTTVPVSTKFLSSLMTALGEAEVMACDMKADAGGDIDLEDLVQYSYENCDGLINYFTDFRHQIQSILSSSD